MVSRNRSPTKSNHQPLESETGRRWVCACAPERPVWTRDTTGRRESDRAHGQVSRTRRVRPAGTERRENGTRGSGLTGLTALLGNQPQTFAGRWTPKRRLRRPTGWTTSERERRGHQVRRTDGVLIINRRQYSFFSLATYLPINIIEFFLIIIIYIINNN